MGVAFRAAREKSCKCWDLMRDLNPSSAPIPGGRRWQRKPCLAKNESSFVLQRSRTIIRVDICNCRFVEQIPRALVKMDCRVPILSEINLSRISLEREASRLAKLCADLLFPFDRRCFFAEMNPFCGVCHSPARRTYNSRS